MSSDVIAFGIIISAIQRLEEFRTRQSYCAKQASNAHSGAVMCSTAERKEDVTATNSEDLDPRQ